MTYRSSASWPTERDSSFRGRQSPMSVELRYAASKSIAIREASLAASQFPPTLTDAVGTISRPAGIHPAIAPALLSHFPMLRPTTFIVTAIVIMYFNYRQETSVLVDIGIWASFLLTLASTADYAFRLRRLIGEPSS